jgi:hypothetical protein
MYFNSYITSPKAASMMCGASAPDTRVQFLRLLVKPVKCLMLKYNSLDRLPSQYKLISCTSIATLQAQRLPVWCVEHQRLTLKYNSWDCLSSLVRSYLLIAEFQLLTTSIWLCQTPANSLMTMSTRHADIHYHGTTTGTTMPVRQHAASQDSFERQGDDDDEVTRATRGDDDI